MFEIFILAIASALFINCVVLPEKCPRVPPTILPKCTNYSNSENYVLRNVPFLKEDRSNLFLERTNNLRVNISCDDDLLKINSWAENQHEPFAYLRSSANVLQKLEKYGLGTNIFNLSGAVECDLKPVEMVWFWFDGDLIFLWSCVEFEGQHDEAVIIIGPKDVFSENTKEFDRAMNKVKATSEKYLKEPLLNKINWKFSRRSDKLEYVGCSVKKPFDYKIPLIVGVVWITVLAGVIVVVIWCNSKKE